MSSQYDSLIYRAAIENGFSPTAAKLVIAQARFESADYTSNVFRNNLNTSGMKFIGQPLATRGTLAPPNERSQSCRRGGTCVNSDHYAKYSSVEDSAKDKIQRLFNKTMNGVTPAQLKNASTPEEFSNLLKKRRYFGFHSFDTDAGKREAEQYANGLRAKLLRVRIQEIYTKNKGVFWSVLGVFMIALGFYLYTDKNALKKLSSKL